MRARQCMQQNLVVSLFPLFDTLSVDSTVVDVILSSALHSAHHVDTLRHHVPTCRAPAL